LPAGPRGRPRRTGGEGALCCVSGWDCVSDWDWPDSDSGGNDAGEEGARLDERGGDRDDSILANVIRRGGRWLVRRRFLGTGLSGYKISRAEAMLSESRTLDEGLLCREYGVTGNSGAGAAGVHGPSAMEAS